MANHPQRKSDQSRSSTWERHDRVAAKGNLHFCPFLSSLIWLQVASRMRILLACQGGGTS